MTCSIVPPVPGTGFPDRFWAGFGRNLQRTEHIPVPNCQAEGPGCLGPDCAPFVASFRPQPAPNWPVRSRFPAWAGNRQRTEHNPVPNCPGRRPGAVWDRLLVGSHELAAKSGPNRAPESRPKVHGRWPAGLHGYCSHGPRNYEDISWVISRAIKPEVGL